MDGGRIEPNSEKYLSYDRAIKTALSNVRNNAEIYTLPFTSTEWRVYVEQEISISDLWIGFVDLILFSPEERTVRVIDHKFMKNKRFVPKTCDSLRRDPQSVIYSKAALEFFGTDSVEVQFDYYGTETFFWESRRFSLTRQEIELEWALLAKEATSVIENYGITSIENACPNYLSCGDFGGCEFKPLCFGG